MAASSIQKNFIVEGTEQVEQFAQAIEDSYQDSLKPPSPPRVQITYLKSPTQIKELRAKWARKNVK